MVPTSVTSTPVAESLKESDCLSRTTDSSFSGVRDEDEALAARRVMRPRRVAKDVPRVDAVENDAMVDDDAVEARPLVWARRGHFAA
tara:strand:- start:268 stop:528 length:261 start_codon:yes stop_codon:yes gene_type:complete